MRRRGIMGVSKGRLPSEYQEVEWVGATDNAACIATGLYCDDGFWKVESTFQFSAYRYSSAVFGTYYQSQYWFGVGGSSANYVYRFGDGDGNVVVAGLYYDLTKRTLIFNGDEDKVYIDGVPISNNTVARCSTHDEMKVGYRNQGGMGFYGKIFDSKFTDKDTGITHRNYIPCYRKSDNVIGMYDLCGSICSRTNTPFYISPYGTFTKGPDVN